MTATFVRPSDADLAAMSHRINGPLSPDGAEAWYRNDVAWLIQEIVLLHQERALAALQFATWLEEPVSDEPLADLAKRWQEKATGLWEKAQIKKLRAEISEQRRQIAELAEAYQRSQERVTELYDANVVGNQELEARVQELDAYKQDVAAETSLLISRLANMDDAMATLRRELLAERSEAERNIAMVNSLSVERNAQVISILKEAIDLL